MSDTKQDPGDSYDHLGNWNRTILRKIIFFVTRGERDIGNSYLSNFVYQRL